MRHAGGRAGDLFGPGHSLLGAPQDRRIGQLHGGDNPTLVLLRDEAGGRPREQHAR